MRSAERDVGGKPENGAFFGSGQTWTLPAAYNITLDADRASSAATNHALQLGATDLEYEVTRVKSPIIGRDMNPMGRGDGTYYPNGGNSAGGSVAIYAAKPPFAGERAFGFGSSMNNQCGVGGLPGWQIRREQDLEPWDPDYYKDMAGLWLEPTGGKDRKGRDNYYIHYFNPLHEACKNSAYFVCDKEPNRDILSKFHSCCVDECHVDDALKLATAINFHCRRGTIEQQCEAYAAWLPATTDEAAYEPKLHWGVVFSFDCAGPKEKRLPLVDCLCSTEHWLSAFSVQQCFIKEFGGWAKGCITPWIPPGGGDGDGDGEEHRVLPPHECTIACTAFCLPYTIPSKPKQCEACCEDLCVHGGNFHDIKGWGELCGIMLGPF